ncbi:MAG: 4,5-dihydroxyphthalate decarboxylase, partial [uncultured Acetobacteraceae bacterium]
DEAFAHPCLHSLRPDAAHPGRACVGAGGGPHHAAGRAGGHLPPRPARPGLRRFRAVHGLAHRHQRARRQSLRRRAGLPLAGLPPLRRLHPHGPRNRRAGRPGRAHDRPARVPADRGALGARHPARAPRRGHAAHGVADRGRAGADHLAGWAGRPAARRRPAGRVGGRPHRRADRAPSARRVRRPERAGRPPLARLPRRGDRLAPRHRLLPRHALHGRAAGRGGAAPLASGGAVPRFRPRARPCAGRTADGERAARVAALGRRGLRGTSGDHGRRPLALRLRPQPRGDRGHGPLRRRGRLGRRADPARSAFPPEHAGGGGV